MSKVTKSLTILASAVAVTALMLGSVNAADVKIGLAGPFTGDLAQFGTQFKNGASLAIEDINKSGGILGNQIMVVEGDDACDPKQAVSVANKFVSEKVTMVVGHFCSGSSIPASDVYKEENIVQISPASTNPTFTERGYANTFRVCGRDDKQGLVAAQYIMKNFKGKNVAILHDKTAYGQGLAEETKKSLNAAGGKEVMFEAITPKEKDYSAVVSQMKAAKVDVIYLGGYHPEAALIVRQAKEQGLKAVLMSGDALQTKEFWSISGDAGEGTLFTFGPDYSKRKDAKELVARFAAKNIVPEGYTLYSYASFQVLQQAAKKANSLKSADIQKTIHSGHKFDTVIGKISFDAKGDVTRPDYSIYKFTKGEWVEITN
ncbi:MAG: branched-chain amino acid ABC transporter substrate-binding protein [Candidatus Pacebacteria bacterium]|nr:branched-chain amino acid ABC transporter substrate-binding protein [Candidatus Paceibacterota bacterium]